MNRSITTTAIATALAFAGGAALAQSYDSMSQDTAVNSPQAMSNASSQTGTAVNADAFTRGAVNAPSWSAPMATSATSAGVNVSAVAPEVILLDSSTPGALKLSSPAVPDTPQNRARFGGPESRTGRATAAAGN